ncbi:MAG: hypothetical protein EOM50_12990 [Erysipelotrichia bacterium]|nr:hypothetical protein [Erysipelotrichia bacterium]
MSEKWYVIKVSEENKLNFRDTQYYVTSFYYASLEDDIDRYGDTVVLITPSEELAENTKKALNEQIREQGY